MSVTVSVQVVKVVEELDLETQRMERFVVIDFFGKQAKVEADDQVIQKLLGRAAGVQVPVEEPPPPSPQDWTVDEVYEAQDDLEDYGELPPQPPPPPPHKAPPRNLHEALSGPPRPVPRARTVPADAMGNPIVPGGGLPNGPPTTRDDEEGTASI